MQPSPGRAPARRRRLQGRSLHLPALLVLLGLALALRLWGIKQGLPYSYNSDEAQHFVPKAIGFFGGDWNPHYFLNPPGYSYLLAIVFELWFGSGDAAIRAYSADPTTVFVIGRVVVCVLGTASVYFTYGAARRLFDRNVALLAAAISAFAFLSVFYSHLALNDVPSLAWVALSLYGIAGVFRDGRLSDYLIAGVAIGLAAATKYTGGVTAICLIVAAARDGARAGYGRALWRLALGGLAAVAAFTLANPYWLLSFSEFRTGISTQASLAAGSQPAKLGTPAGGGIVYYLWSYTWGFGLGPAIAALSGAAIILWRRAWWHVALLVPVQIAFIVFMGAQQRYFGRWLLPLFPLDAALAAYAGCTLVRWLAASRRVPVILGATAVTLALLSQSVLADVHDDRVLSRPYTTNLLRAWMVRHVPAGQNVVIEPVIPSNWPTDIGAAAPWTPTGQRWYQYPTWLTETTPSGRPLAAGVRKYVVVDQYERYLRPSLISRYEDHGYCWVVVGSLQAGRAYATPSAAPAAIQYYRELARVGQLRYRISPYAPGSQPVPFSFDWSIDYYPDQYRLPGPALSVYQLAGGRCAGG